MIFEANTSLGLLSTFWVYKKHETHVIGQYLYYIFHELYFFTSFYQTAKRFISCQLKQLFVYGFTFFLTFDFSPHALRLFLVDTYYSKEHYCKGVLSYKLFISLLTMMKFLYCVFGILNTVIYRISIRKKYQVVYILIYLFI